MYNKIIFLDIDGVLNYIGSRVRRGIYVLDPECTRRLQQVVGEFDAQIVVSSTWRLNTNWKRRLLKEFTDVGWKNPPIIGRTPNIAKYSRLRGGEIREWLLQNPTKQYIIIDDDSDMLEEQLPYFVRTNGFEGGLKEEHVEKIREIWHNEKTT